MGRETEIEKLQATLDYYAITSENILIIMKNRRHGYSTKKRKLTEKDYPVFFPMEFDIRTAGHFNLLENLAESTKDSDDKNLASLSDFVFAKLQKIVDYGEGILEPLYLNDIKRIIMFLKCYRGHIYGLP
ncbi:MAG: hypothetical protein AABW41_02890 [Nanoarchaeota archaeon]